MVSTCIALLLSIGLLIDRYKWHFQERKSGTKAAYYLRLVYVVEKLLYTLSDQQLITGFALLAVLNRKACEISAYHYNLACTMLILSTVTHMNPLIVIHDYFYKGKAIAGYRIAAIITQYGMTTVALSARNTNSFPSKASSLAIMPAACFENMNASNNFGLDDFYSTATNITNTLSNATSASAMNSNSTFNASTTLNEIKAAVAPSQGFAEYIMLVVFLLFAVIFLVAEWWHAEQTQIQKHKIFGWGSIILSAFSITASIIIVGLVIFNYVDLRHGMEVGSWYQRKAAALQPGNYSDFITIFLVTSGSFAAVQAIFGTFCPEGHLFESQMANLDLQNLLRDIRADDSFNLLSNTLLWHRKGQMQSKTQEKILERNDQPSFVSNPGFA
jgi:hypothetical protein